MGEVTRRCTAVHPTWGIRCERPRGRHRRHRAEVTEHRGWGHWIVLWPIAR